jgi:hypothetical protein
MSRESREEKARRLLVSARLTVSCGEDGIEAQVVGDHAVYRLLLTESGWRCPCPSRVTNCAHVLAVEAVTGWRT